MSADVYVAAVMTLLFVISLAGSKGDEKWGWVSAIGAAVLWMCTEIQLSLAVAV